jgi:hypothetical protein
MLARAVGQNRTGCLDLTEIALYLLSYDGKLSCSNLRSMGS